PELEAQLHVNAIESFQASDNGKKKEIQISEDMNSIFTASIVRAIENSGIQPNDVISTGFEIRAIDLRDIQNNVVQMSDVKFVPSNTSDKHRSQSGLSTIWANVIAKQ